VVGDKRCPIVDTWWQTETGGHMITQLPYAWPEKPGSATLPFFGVQPVVVDDKGVELEGECSGLLVLKGAWPSTLRTIYGDHDRYETTYFKPFPVSALGGWGRVGVSVVPCLAWPGLAWPDCPAWGPPMPGLA
jgi:acetyl-CoA synthetase